MRLLFRTGQAQHGASATEYGYLAGLVALVSLGAIVAAGGLISDTFVAANTALEENLASTGLSETAGNEDHFLFSEIDMAAALAGDALPDSTACMLYDQSPDQAEIESLEASGMNCIHAVNAAYDLDLSPWSPGGYVLVFNDLTMEEDERAITLSGETTFQIVTEVSTDNSTYIIGHDGTRLDLVFPEIAVADVTITYSDLSQTWQIDLPDAIDDESRVYGSCGSYIRALYFQGGAVLENGIDFTFGEDCTSPEPEDSGAPEWL